MRSKIVTLASATLITALSVAASSSQSSRIDLPHQPLPTPVQAPDFPPLRVEGLGLRSGTGLPVHLNGDAAWSIIVVPSEQEAVSYLTTRHQQGFNAVLVNLLEHHFGGPRNATGDWPFLWAQDFTQINPAYFEHVDRVLQHAAELQMYVLLAPAYLGYECGEEGWCQEMANASNETLYKFGRYVGHRYKNFNNVIWVHGGDVDGARFGMADKVKAVSDGIRSARGQQLHTAHCARNQNSAECYDWLNLDFDSAYSSCTTIAEILTSMREAQAARQKPFLYIEGIYENMKETPGCLYDQNVRALLAGAVGHIFGNQPVWEFGEGWQQQLDSPGARSMQALHQAMSHLYQSAAGDFDSIPSGNGYYLHFSSDNRIIAYLNDSDTFTAASTWTQHSPAPELCWLSLRQLPDASLSCSRTPVNGSIKAPLVSDWLLQIKP